VHLGLLGSSAPPENAPPTPTGLTLPPPPYTRSSQRPRRCPRGGVARGDSRGSYVVTAGAPVDATRARTTTDTRVSRRCRRSLRAHGKKGVNPSALTGGGTTTRASNTFTHSPGNGARSPVLAQALDPVSSPGDGPVPPSRPLRIGATAWPHHFIRPTSRLCLNRGGHCVARADPAARRPPAGAWRWT